MILNPQGHGDALELSRDWETKDCVGKQTPRCSPNLVKGSWGSEDKKGDTEPACQAIATQALLSPLRNGLLPHKEGRDHSCLKKAEEALRGLKFEVISEELIDFHNLEQEEDRSLDRGKHTDKV